MSQIFLVHDQQASPAARRSALERAGWRVRTTRDGLECLAWLRHEKPELVVLDVLLEGKNGFDLCRMIRDRYTAQELPVVMGCHVYQDREHEAEARAAGAQHYLMLPAALDELVQVVAGLTRDTRGVHAA
jgi:two-component system sensor histidine kinase ChiS